MFKLIENCTQCKNDNAEEGLLEMTESERVKTLRELSKQLHEFTKYDQA